MVANYSFSTCLTMKNDSYEPNFGKRMEIKKKRYLIIINSKF